MTISRQKLIEVALPLEAINKASARVKSIRHGHPSTLHLWWALRPLAACRAVLFASVVDDPSAHPEQFPTEEAQEAERQRLFRLLEELVQWESSNNERVLQAARAEILKSTDGQPPPVYDPFCGGGSIPLEAQRLGLEAHASERWRSDGDCVALWARTVASPNPAARGARAAGAVALALDQDGQEGVGGTAGRPGHDDLQVYSTHW